MVRLAGQPKRNPFGTLVTMLDDDQLTEWLRILPELGPVGMQAHAATKKAMIETHRTLTVPEPTRPVTVDRSNCRHRACYCHDDAVWGAWCLRGRLFLVWLSVGRVGGDPWTACLSGPSTWVPSRPCAGRPGGRIARQTPWATPGVSGGQRNARAVQSEPNKSGQSGPCAKRRDGPPHRTQMRAMGAGDADASHAWTKSPPGTR